MNAVAALIECRRLAYGYPGRPVGRDVDLALEPGEVLVLLGPNGCGKTTLLRTLLGLLPPQGGEVRLLGRPLADYRRREAARILGYVPQASPGYFPFTVLETVLMGRTARLAPFAAPGRRERELARAALAGLGIEALAERPYTRVSGGQRQLSLIARALAQEPQVLIMDEPTASLDFGNQVRVLEQVRRLASEGLAVVLSTHDPDHAFLCGHRVALMREGGLLDGGPPQAVITEAALRELYGVDVRIHALDGGRRVCVPSLAGTA